MVVLWIPLATGVIGRPFLSNVHLAFCLQDTMLYCQRKMSYYGADSNTDVPHRCYMHRWKSIKGRGDV